MMDFTFKAMNSTIMLSGLTRGKQMLVQSFFHEFEQKASRFIEGNELDFINKSPIKNPIFVEPMLADLLAKSIQLSKAFDYYVNPFMGNNMKEKGYSNSFSTAFEPVFVKGESVTKLTQSPVDWIANQWIIKNSDFTFDFGGFGKGYIVDKAQELLIKDDVTHAVINAGGDLSVIGRNQVGIENPFSKDKDMMRFYMQDSSLATSSKIFRKWKKDGKEVHHLLNGRTGEVAENGVIQASIVAKSTMIAETISKLFCILPFEQAKQLVYKKYPHIAYFVFFDDGKVVAGGESSLFDGLEVAS